MWSKTESQREYRYDRAAALHPGIIHLLAELRENNNREWFQANKGRYEADVRDPLLRFIADFALPLHELSATLSPIRGPSVDRSFGFIATCDSRRTRARTRRRPRRTSGTSAAKTYTPRLLPPLGARRRVCGGRHLASRYEVVDQDSGRHRGQPGRLAATHVRRRVSAAMAARRRPRSSVRPRAMIPTTR